MVVVSFAEYLYLFIAQDESDNPLAILFARSNSSSTTTTNTPTRCCNPANCSNLPLTKPLQRLQQLQQQPLPRLHSIAVACLLLAWGYRSPMPFLQGSALLLCKDCSSTQPPIPAVAFPARCSSSWLHSSSSSSSSAHLQSTCSPNSGTHNNLPTVAYSQPLQGPYAQPTSAAIDPLRLAMGGL